MELTDRLIKGISLGIRNALNEAGRISHRTIDRKLWLSVASVCSRNRSTQAELVKPMKKLTKDELIDRYVAALLIMKKPCPKTEKDFESIKTFKLFGKRILEVGGTISEIQARYNDNEKNNGVKAAAATSAKTTPNFINVLDDNPDSAAQQIMQDNFDKYEKSKVDETVKKSRGRLYQIYYVYGQRYSEFCMDRGYSYKPTDDPEERTFLIGEYLMSDDKFDVYIGRYDNLVTSRDRYDRYSGERVPFGKDVLNIRFVPKFYDTEQEATQDYNGLENTCVCLFNNYTAFNETVIKPYSSTAKICGDSYIHVKASYVPALGQLIDAFNLYPDLLKLKGFVWSSTFKDKTHVYAYDGHKVKALDIIDDKAYVVPFINVWKDKRDKINSQLTSALATPEAYMTSLTKDDYLIKNNENLLKLAKSWNLRILEDEWNKIEKKVRYMSDGERQTQIIQLLNQGYGNSDEGKGFRKQIFDNNWNMRVKGMYYSTKNKLYVNYVALGDSTDSEDSILISDLVGTHTDEYARVRFSFSQKDKSEILLKACVLLMYWSQQIKKYKK